MKVEPSNANKEKKGRIRVTFGEVFRRIDIYNALY